MVALTLIVAACTPTPAPAPTAGGAPATQAEGKPEVSTVRVGALPISSLAPFYIAELKGWFQEEGLTIEKIPQFGPQGLQLLESGQMDLNFGDTVSTITAYARGFRLKVVAPASSARDAPPDSSTLLVPVGSSIRRPKDLEGKRVAVDAIGGINWTFIRAAVDKDGGDSNKVQFIELPFPQMPDALINNQVDAANLVEPGRSLALKTGKVEALFYPFILALPGMDISHIVAKEDWIQHHPNTLRRFLKAYARGIAFINQNEAEARRLVAQYANIDPSVAEGMAINAFRPTVQPDKWQQTADLLVKFGRLDKPVQVQSIFHEYALKLPQ